MPGATAALKRLDALTARDTGPQAVAAPGSAAELLTRFLAAQGQRPDAWQLGFLADRSALRLAVVSRQCGKSTCIAADCIHYMTTTPGVLVLLVSNGADQAKELLVRLKAMLTFTGVRPTASSAGALELPNGSRAVCAAPTDKAVRGWTAHKLVCDEGADIPDAVWDAAYATVNATRGQVTAIGSAKAPAGWFHEAATDAGKGWSSRVVTINDLARFTADEIAAKRRAARSDTAFQREYLSQFVGLDGAYFDRTQFQAAADAGDALADRFRKFQERQAA